MESEADLTPKPILKLPTRRKRKRVTGCPKSIVKANTLLVFTAVFFMAMTLMGCKSTQGRTPELILQPKTPVPYPGPPTVTRIVLKYEAGQFTLVNAVAKRDSIPRLNVTEHVDHIRAGEEALFYYRLLSPASTVIAVGSFVVPLVAEMAYTGRGHRIVHDKVNLPNSVINVSVPYSEEAASVEIEQAIPTESNEPANWPRRKVSTLKVPGNNPQ